MNYDETMLDAFVKALATCETIPEITEDLLEADRAFTAQNAMTRQQHKETALHLAKQIAAQAQQWIQNEGVEVTQTLLYILIDQLSLHALELSFSSQADLFLVWERLAAQAPQDMKQDMNDLMALPVAPILTY